MWLHRILQKLIQIGSFQEYFNSRLMEMLFLFIPDMNSIKLYFRNIDTHELFKGIVKTSDSLS